MTTPRSTSKPKSSLAATDYDIILVGGGLANGLIADRLLASRPNVRLLVIERDATLGGNHTWSFHDTDITPAQHAWLAPYVEHRWPRQEVRFEGLTRVLDTGYCSVPSDRFHAQLAAKLGPSRYVTSEVVTLAPNAVVLSNQQRLTATCVIDGRGPRRDDALALGFQKFIGREIETVTPHGQRWPIIMDATVSQKDGYRFVYTLPLDDRRLLIEDTYYSDRPDIDLSPLRGGIDAYALSQGWRIARDIREEHGVLPIVLAGDMARFWSEDDDVPRVGLRAALFHPTTGYSLPDAVKLAEALVALPELTSATVAAAIRTHSRALWDNRDFFRLLNRMLFIAAAGDERARVMARFYSLPESLIRRFYAGSLTFADKARIVTGKPPIPIYRALPCLSTATAWRFARANEGGV